MSAPVERSPGERRHQNWMRDYDPTTGRYLQADPLGLVDGASVYGYVKQSPMMYMDPTGLQTGSGGVPIPNRTTRNLLPDCCEKHHPIQSAYLPLIEGKAGKGKPRQGRVAMSPADHRALHEDLNKWMRDNCVKCLAGGAVANAAFSSVNGGDIIRDNFTLTEIISSLDEYWESEGGWRKGKWPDVYAAYKVTVRIWRGKGIF